MRDRLRRPHPATVVQRRAPHPATTAPAQRPPHPATVVQAKAAAGRPTIEPHVAQRMEDENDEMYQEYLRRQKTWGRKPPKDTKYGTVHVEHHKDGYRRLPVVIEGTKSEVASGFIKLHEDTGKLEVSQVAVNEDHRGRGLTYFVIFGLMLYAVKRMNMHGSTVVWLEADPQSNMSKEELVNIYEKCGFERKGGTSTGNPYMEGTLQDIYFACNTAAEKRGLFK